MRERDPALSAVRHLLEGCRQGVGGALFVTGAAGIGKSSLLEAAVDEADPGFTIRRARGTAMERRVGLAYARCFLGPLTSGREVPPAPAGPPRCRARPGPPDGALLGR